MDNEQDLRYQKSILIFTSTITHGQTYKGLHNYLSLFDKVFLLKEANDSIKGLIYKQTLVSLRVSQKGKIAILERIPSPSFY